MSRVLVNRNARRTWVALSLVCAISLGPGCAKEEAPAEKAQSSADEISVQEQNKAVCRRLREECVNQGKMALADELLDSEYVDHNATPELPPGIEGFKMQVVAYRIAFPDLHVIVQDMVAEENRVATRWTATGTHTGELMGIPATGKHVTVNGISIDRVVGGKVVESWGIFDRWGVMEQLGVAPTPGDTVITP